MTLVILRCTLLVAGICLLMACTQRQPNSAANQADTATGTKAITAVPDLGPPPAVPDTQFIIVDSMANVRVNDSLIPRRRGAFGNSLMAYWLQCYNSTQKLPKFLRFKYQGTVMMGARGNLMDAVVQVQDSLKDHIATEKYLQDFHRLDPQHQKELEQMYPVLFQKQL